MRTIDMIATLQANSYSLSLIARQSGVAYHNLYRFSDGLLVLSDEDEAAVRAFCEAQPCIRDAKK